MDPRNSPSTTSMTFGVFQGMSCDIMDKSHDYMYMYIHVFYKFCIVHCICVSISIMYSASVCTCKLYLL